MDYSKLINFIQQNPGFSLLTGMIGILTLNLFKLIVLSAKAKSKHNSLIKEGKKTLDERNERIANFLNKYKNEVSKEKQEYIVKLTASELCEEIKNKKITSKEAFITYALRVGTIGKDLKLIADINFELGLKDAEKADELIQSTLNKEDLPALIGLPISIKDHIRVKGLRSTSGLVANHNDIDDQDAYIVEVLKQAGAVILCKGNVPQGMLTLESSNRLWGNAENPWNKSKTPGGSSGGEAGLVTTHCAPIGLGSDIGGSIRNPAYNCGIYGFKPSLGMLSSKRIKQLNGKNVYGFNAVEASTGPIANSMDDIILFIKALYGNFPKDFGCSKSEFNYKNFLNYSLFSNINTKNSTEKSTISFRIGYNYTFPRTEVAPGIIKEIEKTLSLLKDAGHQLVEFPYHEFDTLLDKGLEVIFNSQKFHVLRKSCKGEMFMNYYNSVNILLSMPSFLIKPIAFILNLTGNKRKAEMLRRVKYYNSIPELFKGIEELTELKEEFYNKYNDLKLDCLVLPVQPFPALDIGKADMSSANIFYTMMLNFLDMPCGNIPLGLLKDNSYKSVYTDKMRYEIEDSIKSSLNLPIGLQVATLPKEDEKCLGIMSLIDSLVRINKEKQYIEYLSKNSKIGNTKGLAFPYAEN